MDKIWISFFTLLLVLLRDVTNGQSDIKAQLIVKKYVEKGSNVVLQCKHNVNSETLYKVSFFKIGDKKFYEYIAGRDPPFRKFPLIGAEIDFDTVRYLPQQASPTIYTACDAIEGSVNFTVAPNNCDENGGEKDQSSNINQVSLKRLDYEAAGLYYCEVSTDTPIFTKASNEEQLHVILSQTGPPKINLEKRLYYVGEKLIANCTTSKARPSPHITWLIDGKMVDEKYTKPLHLYSSGGKNSHRSKSHQQNNPSYEKSSQNSEIYTKGMISTKENPYELPDHNSNNNMGFEIHPPSGYNLDNNFEIEYNKKESLHNQQDFYLENKYFNSRKHRNSKKYRRYVNDGGEKKSTHKIMTSSSQLNIEIAKLLPHNGRLEITCLATIPAHVEIGEEFADYKTSSVRIDIETPETTSLVPSRIGASALDGNGNHANTITFSKHNYRFIIILLCLPLLLFIIN